MFSFSLESLHTDLSTVIAAVTVLVVLVHLVPYLIDSRRLRSYPGPLIAKFSDAWLGYVSHQGHRSEVIYDLHRKYGPFVRIAPNHVSVAVSDAQSMVYGHGNGALKSSFYDVFITTSIGIFTARDRPTHTRKRKIISHTFSQKSVLEFEPHVHRYVGQLLGQWDKLYDKALKGMSGEEVLMRIPMFRKGGENTDALVGMAVAAVSKRLEGNPMGREELTAEAFTLLIAGSDTTSNSTCAIIYYLARTPGVQQKLHKELDDHLESDVATAERVKNLAYLQAVINEGLRLHSTVGIGLPRVAPEGGMTILGNYIPGGTIISVPTYTIHRDPAVFGDDIEEFRPERWFECDSAGVSKAFSPFSVGPRACIGRNLANFELQIIIASILKRYHFVLENPDEVLKVQEGFLRKPIGCRVGMNRREVL
ncbi:cytochrome P450 [Armillaria solidipes]|uniref:Cytochrome P450 n=1 Tax=Armillaria solidipes TaxID=1076256 RepID=A0A2H3BE49_9AGAR|nr:cytochrome P450 [Armillaria solidipes]